jgi:hypothetical protein
MGGKLMCSFDIEICSNCGREIGRSEQAYVFEGKIVCAECDKALRTNLIVEPAEIPESLAEQGPITTTELQFEEPDQSISHEKEKEKEYQEKNKHHGLIIVGVILLTIGISLIGLGLLGLIASFLAGILIGILPAGWLLTLGILITILGITAIIASATFR